MHPDRLFSSDVNIKKHARALYEIVANQAIISPHGHTDPVWFAQNIAFSDPVALMLAPDHYLIRMLNSQGLDRRNFGVSDQQGLVFKTGKAAWLEFAKVYHLFLGTASGFWFDSTLSEIFGIEQRLDANNADSVYTTIQQHLQSDDYRPCNLLDKFNIELIATTEGASNPLKHHQQLQINNHSAEWSNRVISTYRPDDVCDPTIHGFVERLTAFIRGNDEDETSWSGMINAHRKRRAFFRQHGATATDHGTATARTVDLSSQACQNLLDRFLTGKNKQNDAELFQAQMLTEMAGLSAEDGMVMQLHAGCYRNHDQQVCKNYGADAGADIPLKIDFVNDLAPLLNKYGHDEKFKMILFTLDESTYSRELAPLVSHWPCLLLGPPWWFSDSPTGIKRYFEQVVEVTGFSNLAGFNDDARSLLSIPARHDVWRRCLCNYLGTLVSQNRIGLDDAQYLAIDLSGPAAKRAYKL